MALWGLTILPLAATLTTAPASRYWTVSMLRGAERHQLRVPENEPLLTAVERAGLLPSSECRRGRCLSCAARVLEGAPFSLRVDGCTALCDEAHAEGLVLLCSAFAVGPGLELELGCESDAWDTQYRKRWTEDIDVPEPPLGPRPIQYRVPDDAPTLLERCVEMPDAAKEE